eukprot:COSAG01_NODE_54835_length_329_cov_0.900000_1_plen_48_part_10
MLLLLLKFHNGIYVTDSQDPRTARGESPLACDASHVCGGAAARAAAGG